MASQDFCHLCSIRRTTGCRVDHVSRFAEILRTDFGWRDHAKHLCVSASVIIEPVNRTARNAERLPRANIELFAIDGPGQRAFNAVNGLFVMVVAMRGSRQALSRRDADLKGCDAAMG